MSHLSPRRNTPVLTSSPVSQSAPLPEIPVGPSNASSQEQERTISFADEDVTPTGATNGEQQLAGVGAHGRLSRNASQVQVEIPRPARVQSMHREDRPGERPYSVRRQSTATLPPPHAIRGPGSEMGIPILDQRRGPVRRTVGERLQDTLLEAEKQRDKYAHKAKINRWSLNIAIGLQVLLGSLTTGLSALSTNNGQFAITTSILGGISTLVASFLARARGSGEPELSTARTKDLEHFMRELRAFIDDSGHLYGADDNEESTEKQKMLDETVQDFRARLEDLLGNADSQRKLAPPV